MNLVLVFYLCTLSSTNFGLVMTGLSRVNTLSISSCGSLMCSKEQRLLHWPHNCARMQSCLHDGNNSLLRVRAAAQRTPTIGRRSLVVNGFIAAAILGLYMSDLLTVSMSLVLCSCLLFFVGGEVVSGCLSRLGAVGVE